MVGWNQGCQISSIIRMRKGWILSSKHTLNQPATLPRSLADSETDGRTSKFHDGAVLVFVL